MHAVVMHFLLMPIKVRGTDRFIITKITGVYGSRVFGANMQFQIAQVGMFIVTFVAHIHLEDWVKLTTEEFIFCISKKMSH